MCSDIALCKPRASVQTSKLVNVAGRWREKEFMRAKNTARFINQKVHVECGGGRINGKQIKIMATKQAPECSELFMLYVIILIVELLGSFFTPFSCCSRGESSLHANVALICTCFNKAQPRRQYGVGWTMKKCWAQQRVKRQLANRNETFQVQLFCCDTFMVKSVGRIVDAFRPRHARVIRCLIYQLKAERDVTAAVLWYEKFYLHSCTDTLQKHSTAEKVSPSHARARSMNMRLGVILHHKVIDETTEILFRNLNVTK